MAHALRKGQAAIFNFTQDVTGSARIEERTFGSRPGLLAEAIEVSGKGPTSNCVKRREAIGAAIS